VAAVQPPTNNFDHQQHQQQRQAQNTVKTWPRSCANHLRRLLRDGVARWAVERAKIRCSLLSNGCWTAAS
jgi:hypothetical protein